MAANFDERAEIGGLPHVVNGLWISISSQQVSRHTRLRRRSHQAMNSTLIAIALLTGSPWLRNRDPVTSPGAQALLSRLPLLSLDGHLIQRAVQSPVHYISAVGGRHNRGDFSIARLGTISCQLHRTNA